MEKLHADSRSFGDVVLDLLKRAKPTDYKSFPDYYGYLKSAVINAKPAYDQGPGRGFLGEHVEHGVLHRAGSLQPLSVAAITPAMLELPPPAGTDFAYPFHLIPAVSASLRDGRPANLPWLQESPDPLTTVVWIAGRSCIRAPQRPWRFAKATCC